jgi:hypothetical protein
MRYELQLTCLVMSAFMLIALLVTYTFSFPRICILYSVFVPMIVVIGHAIILTYQGKI